VPEAIVGVHSKMRVLAISTVTNECRPDTPGVTTGEEVVEIGKTAEHKVRAIVMGILGEEVRK
ncbi:MAG TPA: purine-nucleoside phosphorylase, partial [Pirellulales bacterium]